MDVHLAPLGDIGAPSQTGISVNDSTTPTAVDGCTQTATMCRNFGVFFLLVISIIAIRIALSNG
jgi:hypothetical protein